MYNDFFWRSGVTTGGQLPPGAAAEGAQNGLTKICYDYIAYDHKNEFMHFVNWTGQK